MTRKTLYDKVWDAHVVAGDPAGRALLYADLHLIHEVTSPQAFEALRAASRSVRRPDRTMAVEDHNVPTVGQSGGVKEVADRDSRIQLEALEANVMAAGIPLFKLGDPHNGIVHVVAPEQGRSQPGMIIVCGDSHTSTHGAFGALAFGVGTAEVEHVLATQTIWQTKSQNLRINFEGSAPNWVGPKDLALHMLGHVGASGARGFVIEYAGPAVRALSMEGRMTLCNMSIEAGARAGMVAPDEITFSYLRGRPGAPSEDHWIQAETAWRALLTDDDAVFDREITIDVSSVVPTVTWGTSPDDVLSVTQEIPDPARITDPVKSRAAFQALEYMGLKPGTRLTDIPVTRVFIGSCTNGRLEDLRQAAAIARGRRVAAGVQAIVVPGSGQVRLQAEAEGLHQVFTDAGFEWREPGCSMCIAMNGDRLDPYERCASTSNRNFEGRQGRHGRTHLMSPGMAAAAAVAGRIIDVREFDS